MKIDLDILSINLGHVKRLPHVAVEVRYRQWFVLPSPLEQGVRFLNQCQVVVSLGSDGEAAVAAQDWVALLPPVVVAIDLAVDVVETVHPFLVEGRLVSVVDHFGDHVALEIGFGGGALTAWAVYLLVLVVDSLELGHGS